MWCALFLLALLGCVCLGLVGLFLINDEVEEWEDHKHEHDRRKP